VNVVSCEKVKVHGEFVVEIGKIMATNGIGLGVEFELKKLQGSIKQNRSGGACK
jgi:hypothetical protein